MKIKRNQILKLVKALPAEVDVDDLIYRLYLLAKLAAAEADIAAGRVMSTEELRKRATKWGR